MGKRVVLNTKLALDGNYVYAIVAINNNTGTTTRMASLAIRLQRTASYMK